MKEKKLNMLGLAQRAGFLISGDEFVSQAVKQGQIKLIVCGSDASVKTKERYQALAEQNRVKLNIEFTQSEISQAIGKKRMVCGLTNSGMVKTFLSYETGEDDMYDK